MNLLLKTIFIASTTSTPMCYMNFATHRHSLDDFPCCETLTASLHPLKVQGS